MKNDIRSLLLDGLPTALLYAAKTMAMFIGLTTVIAMTLPPTIALCGAIAIGLIMLWNEEHKRRRANERDEILLAAVHALDDIYYCKTTIADPSRLHEINSIWRNVEPRLNAAYIALDLSARYPMRDEIESATVDWKQ